jgi:hypothetical protein
LGTAHAHTDPLGKGAFVSEWTINKTTLAVTKGADLIQKFYSWNTSTQSSSVLSTATSFDRFCSADLAEKSAFSYNGIIGTNARIFLNGEESGSGRALAHVATGAGKGNSFELGKFNTTTNGSGGTAVGGWENLLANPYSQLKTVVIGTNDGGTGFMNNSLGVYVGTKTSSGTDADRAGLTNGVIKFVNVAGVTAEVTAANAATRNTAIASGAKFTLGETAATTFSRPEDGAWNPNSPNEFYFVTTDRIDTTDLTGGTQKGATRLWRLTFDDIKNVDAGGKIDLLIDGGSFAAGAGKPNMFDNMTVNADGTLTLQEDTGNAEHNAKIWNFDPATGALKMVAKASPTLFGDITAGSFVAGTHTKDEETSGVIDITSLLGRNDGKQYSLLVTQDHASALSLGLSNPTTLVEGGQLLVMTQSVAAAVPEPETYALMLGGLAMVGFLARRRRAD